SHEGTYASLESAEDAFTVGINRAVTLLAERKEKGGRGPRTAQALKELGAHPESGSVIKVMKGRYGPYVTDGTVNATLPRDSDPASVTLDEAVALIAARAEKGPVKKKRGAAKKSANGETKAPAAKKSAAQKKASTPAADASTEKPKRSARAKAKA